MGRSGLGREQKKGELHMKTTIRRFIIGILCMSLMLLCVMPVSAQEYVGDTFDMFTSGNVLDAVCPHTDRDVDVLGPSYKMKDTGSHYVNTTHVYTCRQCGKISNYHYESTENHSLSYDDLGHSDLAHDYILKCRKCSYSQRISIPCNGGANHNTPF